VRHRVGLQVQVTGGVPGHRQRDPMFGRQPAQRGTQFAALVGDQPGVNPPGRFGAGAAVKGDAAPGELQQQPGRRVPGRVHRPHAEQRQP